jgi:hypothetical protein
MIHTWIGSARCSRDWCCAAVRSRSRQRAVQRSCGPPQRSVRYSSLRMVDPVGEAECRCHLPRVGSEPGVCRAGVKIHLALLGRFGCPRLQNAAVSLQALCSDHAVGLRLSWMNDSCGHKWIAVGPVRRSFSWRGLALPSTSLQLEYRKAVCPRVGLRPDPGTATVRLYFSACGGDFIVA